ncbi:MAG: hypothetical protein ACLFN8_00350 [Candidatus Woesearchaeota archaeon]
MIKHKKAQTILFSVMLALFVFLLVLTFFFDSLMTRPVIGNDKTKILENEATRLGDAILLTGYPSNWSKDTVQKIGLMTNNALDQQKIYNLTEIAKNNFGKSKILLGVQNDYFINISYQNSTGPQEHIINNTPINNALNHKFTITRERISLINIDGNRTPAKIFIILYSN